MTDQTPTPEDSDATVEAKVPPTPPAAEPDQPAPISELPCRAAAARAAAARAADRRHTAAAPPPPLTEPLSAEERPGPPPAPEFGSAGPASAAGANERPEIPIAAAFAGGFVLALLLKRLAR